MWTERLLPTVRSVTPRALVFLILTALAFLISGLVLAATGEPPLLALTELVQGTLGTRTNIAATITRSIPMIVNGIAAAIAFKAGLFNLGLEGQMVMGALAAAVCANVLRDWPPLLLLPVVIMVGGVAGGLWALPPAWWQTRFKVPLLVTTLLLNYIAGLFASYLVNFPLRDLARGGGVAQTVMIPETIRFVIILPGTRLHAGVIVLFILPVVTVWFFRRTVIGYNLRLTGLNPDFAAYGGIAVARTVLLAMFMSGATAGLAGVIQVLGVDFRYIDGALVTPGFAWSGFIAAILAASNPLLIVVTGLFLAGLKVGAAGMQRNTQIPLQIADVVQAVIIFMVAIRLRVGELVKRLVFPNSSAS
jgi:simple sugar transport system permease protein